MPVGAGGGLVALPEMDHAALEQGLGIAGVEGERPADVVHGEIEAVERAVRRGAEDEDVGAPRRLVEHPVEVVEGLPVVAGAGERDAAVDEQFDVPRPAVDGGAEGVDGALAPAQQQPGLPGLTEQVGAELGALAPLEVRRQAFEGVGRVLEPLQRDEGDGGAVTGGVAAAVVRPRPRPFERLLWPVAGEVHAVGVALRLLGLAGGGGPRGGDEEGRGDGGGEEARWVHDEAHGLYRIRDRG